jgi:hypothetical protein
MTQAKVQPKHHHHHHCHIFLSGIKWTRSEHHKQIFHQRIDNISIISIIIDFFQESKGPEVKNTASKGSTKPSTSSSSWFSSRNQKVQE